MNRNRAASILAIPVLAVAGIAIGTSSAAADQTVVVEACDGVTVIVDFTDLDGAVESGCAEGDPASGREALESAGFTPIDSQPGLICTINSQPDPCPTEFEGSYWAYWQVVDGEWALAATGADDTDPSPGAIEGWRYNDGSVPPPLAQVPAEQTSAEEPSSAATAEAEDSAGGGVPVGIWVVIGVVVVALVAGLVVRRQRAGGS